MKCLPVVKYRTLIQSKFSPDSTLRKGSRTCVCNQITEETWAACKHGLYEQYLLSAVDVILEDPRWLVPIIGPRRAEEFIDEYIRGQEIELDQPPGTDQLGDR